ncbi:MAG: GTPase, partial [Actinomycetota bacterium]|nr:GTPase [Actinomycetota bacterium]
MERFGFVGLPNAGKSSLYNALAGGGALAAPYAFATTAPNIGVARVPDDRLERLATMSASRRVVPATVEFADIGGLVEGASQGEGLGNRFLAGIREVDAIVFVLRAFRDDDVPGPTDPLEHLRVVEMELALADLDTAEKQLYKVRRASKGDPTLAGAVAALGSAVDRLAEGVPLYRSDLTASERNELQPFFLLTDKPVLAVVNLDEDQVVDPDEVLAPVAVELAGAVAALGSAVDCLAEGVPLYRSDLTASERNELRPFFLLTDKPVLAVVNLDEVQVVDPDEVLAPVTAELAGAEVIGMCVQLEAEAALLGDRDRAEMLDGLGLGEGALP